jgi:hypothetical protein
VAYDALAIILGKAGKFEESPACLRRAIAADPNVAVRHCAGEQNAVAHVG